MLACNKNEASPLTSEAFYPSEAGLLALRSLFCLTVVSRSVRFSKFQPVQTRWHSWSTWESEHSGWFKLRTSVMLSSSPPSFKTCKNSVLNWSGSVLRPLGWCSLLPLERLACRCSCNPPTSQAPDFKYDILANYFSNEMKNSKTQFVAAQTSSDMDNWTC